MELYDAEKMELKYQVTNKVPIFEVSSLDPGVPIKLYLYAENAKGTSDPAIIDDSAQNQQRLGVEGMSPQEEVEDITLYLPPAEFLCYSIRNCISFNRIEEHLLCWIFFSGVTDFKAVVDSSTSDAPPTSYSLLLITSSVGGIFVVTVLTLCIVFTYRRKVRHHHKQDTQNMRKSFFCGFFSSGIAWMVFCLCQKVIYYRRKNPFSWQMWFIFSITVVLL